MTTKRAEPSENRCQLRFADERRCALLAHPQGDGLCYPHAHSPQRRLRPSDLTRELASPSSDVSSQLSDLCVLSASAVSPSFLFHSYPSSASAMFLITSCQLQGIGCL